jgi:benzodiazapine receptor
MKALAVFALLAAATAAAAAQFQPGAWYAALAKPAWTPPDWVFAPVWGVLYTTIALAGWLAWRRGRRAGAPLALWLAQLALNAGWSWLFFGLHEPGIAFLEILLLVLAIGGFIGAAAQVSRGAALLFVPYALWVAYAAALNFALWRLNPST